MSTMYTYTNESGSITITGYNRVGGAVVIPSIIDGLPVTAIGSSAFSHCSGLTNVVIPDSVTTTGDWAFSHCYGLTEVVIPNSVATIGNGAFAHCTGLKK
jgi:hypothetical protein